MKPNQTKSHVLISFKTIALAFAHIGRSRAESHVSSLQRSFGYLISRLFNPLCFTRLAGLAWQRPCASSVQFTLLLDRAAAVTDEWVGGGWICLRRAGKMRRCVWCTWVAARGYLSVSRGAREPGERPARAGE